MVRRFVSEVLRGEGGAELTDDEWTHLCEGEPGRSVTGEAIAHLVLRAYALRVRPGADDAPTGGRLAVAPTIAWTAPSRPRLHRIDEWMAPSAGPSRGDRNHHIAHTGRLRIGRRPRLETSEHGCSPGVPGEPGRRDRSSDDRRPRGLSVTAWPLEADPVPAIDVLSAGVDRSRPRRSEDGIGASAAAQQRSRAPRARRSRGAPADGQGRNASTGTTARGHLVGPEHRHHHPALRLLAGVGYGHHPASVPRMRSRTSSKPGVHHAVAKPKPGFSLVPATTRIPDPPQGTVMAHLQIPKIALDEFVVSGTNEADLAKGPGHYLGTAMPGQAGNVAIAGHRTTHGAPFNRLAELAIGDPDLPDHVGWAAAHLHRLGRARPGVAQGRHASSTTSGTTG